MLVQHVEVSHNMKVGALVAAACVAAGGAAAFAVSKLHAGTASGGRQASGLQPGVVGSSRGFGFAPPNGFDRRGPFFGLGRGGGLSAAAGYLGLPSADLFAKLQSGQTLAQIADATAGKSASGLIAAMTAAQKSELATAVRDGRLTQAQADRLSANLTARITAMVNGELSFGRRFGNRGGTAPTTL